MPSAFTLRQKPEPNAKEYTIDQVAEALSEITRWLINDGRFQQRGVYNRAVMLAFLIHPTFVGITSQVELAKKLGLSEAQVSELVRTFMERFDFMAAHLRTRCREQCRKEKRK